MTSAEASPWENPFLVADAAAWRTWLDQHEDEPEGVWLVLAKKGRPAPTTLTYDLALDEALCSGWIDGQKRARDADTHVQRFTPRRRASMWSERNTTIVERLRSEGRMRERGEAEIDRAKADGRWDRAYAGSATAQVPEDLVAALAHSPHAAAQFESLSRQARFSVLHPIITAASPATRAKRIAAAVSRLSAEPTP